MTGSNVAKKYENERVKTQRDVQVVNVKRNPYLADYQQHRNDSMKVVSIERESKRRKDSKNQSLVRDNSSTQKTVHRNETPRNKTQRNKAQRNKIQRKRKLLIRRGIVLLVATTVLCIAIALSISLIAKAVNAIQGWMDSDSQAQNKQKAQTEWQIDESELIQGLTPADYGTHPTWTADFLTPNEYSRPGDALEEVNSVFVHYTANAGTSAAQNRSYFEQQKDTHERSVSAHFIIGYEGEIIQCVPLDEIAYAVQTRNFDSISIECCYLEEDGSFTQETYDSLIELLQWLVDVYDLDADEDILRHYDCGGKKCPIYYTEHEDAWERLKEDVKTL